MPTTYFDDKSENQSENVNIGEKPPTDQIQLTPASGELSKSREEDTPVIHQHHIVENDDRRLANRQTEIRRCKSFSTHEEIIEVIRPKIALLIRSTGGIAKRDFSAMVDLSPAYASSAAGGTLITPRKSHMPSTA